MKRLLHSRLNQYGFSLLEAVIAVSVLAIGLLSLLSLQVMVTRGNKGSMNLTSAVMLAESEIEQLKAGGFSALTNGTFNDLNNPVNETGQAGGIFIRSWTIATYLTTMKQVTVTVTWADQIGSNRSISLNYVMSSTVN